MPLPRNQLTPSRTSLALRFHPALGVSLVLLLLAAVLLFGVIGASVAQEVEAYRGYAWVPHLLVMISAVLMVCILVRALRRPLIRK